MIGKDLSDVEALQATHRAGEDVVRGTPFLEAVDIGRKGSIQPVDISIYAGEVLGLAGLLGSGRTETARLLFGADRADTGTIRIEGKRAMARTESSTLTIEKDRPVTVTGIDSSYLVVRPTD